MIPSIAILILIPVTICILVVVLILTPMLTTTAVPYPLLEMTNMEWERRYPDMDLDLESGNYNSRNSHNIYTYHPLPQRW